MEGCWDETTLMRLIDNLKAFNRKERFILLHKALGFTDQSFRLGKAFRKELSRQLPGTVPPDAFVAMDYHLDWLQMAMYLTDHPRRSGPIKNDNLVEGNQMDIDLLVAFENADKTHVVLVEAKGDTAWNNDQLSRKVERLRLIFRSGGPGTESVKPYFVMMSPKKSANQELNEKLQEMEDSCPSMKTNWLPLPLPNGLVKATRCDREGNSNANKQWIRLDIVSPAWVPTNRVGRS